MFNLMKCPTELEECSAIRLLDDMLQDEFRRKTSLENVDPLRLSIEELPKL